MTPWRMNRTRFTRCLPALAAAVLAGALAAPAPAQLGQAAGIAKSTTPEYFRRDVLIFVEGLDLDESQRLIVEGLFEDYIDSFDEGFAGLQRRLEEMRPELQGDERQIMKRIFEPFLDWFEEYDRLGEQFLENIRTVLNEQQMQVWPEFRRRLRREKTMGDGQLAGEKIDLFDIVRDLRLDDETMRRIQPILEEYDLALDDALRQRNDALKRGRSIMIQSIQTQAHDRSLQTMRQQIQHRVQVRDVNLLYIDNLAEALPPSIGLEMRSEALRKAFPQVFRPQPAERMFTAALALEGLDPDTLAAVDSLLAAYRAELDAMNQILFEGVKRDDPQTAINRVEAFAARMRGERAERQDDGARELFQRREDLGFTYMSLLNDLLTEEQFTSLPGASRWYQREKLGSDGRPSTAERRTRQPASRRPTLNRRNKSPNREKELDRGSGPAAGNGGGSTRQ